MKRYVKASIFEDDYFGKEERDLCGDLITKMFKGWVISKRKSDLTKTYGLDHVSKLLKQHFPDRCKPYISTWRTTAEEKDFNLYTILRALEGMCSEDEAVEVADGFYYVGSYSDWEKDTKAQSELNIMISQ